jgi:hypothetical protein
VNFALGVRDFDVAQHQPHPPGYPLFIALGKTATPVMRAIGVAGPEVRGLAVWSALGGALAIACIWMLFAYPTDAPVALLTTSLSAASPLFWFTALRPLSDMSGLAAAFAAMALLVRAAPNPSGGVDEVARARALLFGAAATGLAAGFRAQTTVLTMPLLAYVLIASRIPPVARMRALAACVAGGAVWAVPLIVASGGPAAYVRALGSQAGEDFTGVVMLWTSRSPRIAAFAMLNTFVLPWDSPVLAGIVLMLALGGIGVLALRWPRALILFVVMFGPYAIFHILFQETVTVRYALPVVVSECFAAAVLLAEAVPAFAVVGCAALCVWGLALGVPAGLAFGRSPSPAFDALDRMNQAAGDPVIAMHRRQFTETRRARQWSGGLPGTLLPSPRDFEWLELTRSWREGFAGPAWFVADPRRTDLTLIDPQGRTLQRFRWPFKKAVYVGGARPDEIDWYIYEAPGWFLEQGWALTPEIAGISEREGWRPHLRPSVGWVRRRSGPAVMMLGGRHLGSASDRPVHLAASIDGTELAGFDVTPGFFLRFVPLAAGALAGQGRFGRLTVTATSAAAAAPPAVALEQFNLQSPDAVQFGFAEGWQEPEYNPQTSKSWRWMSERAVLAVHTGGHGVTLRIDGESPLRYYDAPPEVAIRVGDRVITTAHPDRDFTIEAAIPVDLLTAAGDRVTLESSRMFVPGEKEGTADRRHLALRIYSVQVSGRD